MLKRCYSVGCLKPLGMLMFNLLFQHAQKYLQPFLHCQLCHSATVAQHSVCLDCWHSLPWQKDLIQKQDLSIWVACRYDYPINRIIHQFKYEQQLHYQALLAASLLQLNLPKVQAIVPMPISHDRLTERGYNQTVLLAKILSKQLNIPIWQPLLRHKQMQQKGLNRLERLDNIQKQFFLARKPKKIYRRVLILDDVVTTGASLNALKQSLEHLGCQKVYACCVANAI